MNLNTNERWWVATLQELIKEARYGKIDVCLTIKNFNVTNVKNKTEKSFSFNNDGYPHDK